MQTFTTPARERSLKRAVVRSGKQVLRKERSLKRLRVTQVNEEVTGGADSLSVNQLAIMYGKR